MNYANIFCIIILLLKSLKTALLCNIYPTFIFVKSNFNFIALFFIVIHYVNYIKRIQFN